MSISRAYPQPPCDHTDVYGMSGKPGSGQFNYPAFTFPGPQGLQYTQLVHAGKGAVYYHPHPATHLPEDQGIDMTQSPGRDSPGSSGSGSTSSGCGGGGGGGRSSGSAGGGSAGGGSAGGGSGGGCRHSTASLDSGRASSGFIPASSSSSSSSGGGSGGSGSGGGSGGSSSGGSHARCSLDSSPRCSLSSSSSIASSSAAEHHHAALFGCGCGSGQGGGAAARVERLMQQGVLPDQDIIQSWLMDLHFEEYFPLFASAGYDMPTISRMTPEDLTAIGIKKPNHRKRLKAEIALLNISDGLPEYIPSSIEEWLGLLGLSEYAGALRQQGCRTVEDVASGVTWEDLEDVGIVRLGHQKKILLAIKRVKDIKAGKRFPQPGAIPPGGDHPINVLLVPPHLQPHIIQQQQQMHQPQIRGGRGKSLESLEDGGTGTSHLTFSGGGGGGGGTGFQHHPQMPQLHLPQMQHPMHSHPFYPQPHIHHPHLHYFRGTAVAPLPGWRPRSYDDGDITPTNEGHLQSLLLHHHLHHHSTAFTEGGGTLPRQRSSSTTGGGPVQMPFPTLKPRPVAKIAACTQNTVRFKGDGEAGEEDEDEEDDDDDDEEGEEEGGEEGEDGKGGKKGERKKKKKKNLALMAEFEKQSLQMPPPMPLHACAYKSLPRDLAERDRYFAMAAAGMRKVPPSPPKRNPPPPSVGPGLRPGDGETATHPGAVTTGGDADSDQRKTSPPGQVVGCDSAATASPLMERQQRVTFQQDRVPQSTLSAPQMASGEAMNASGMAARAVGTSSPPGPAPSSASHRWDGSSSLSDFSEQDGMMGLPGNGGILGMHQNRNGSDASFKSSSSTESDSLPFANENAGTIKQRAARPHPTLSSAMDYPKQEYGTPKRSQPTSQEVQMQFRDRMGNNGGVTSERAAASNQVNCGVSNVECSAPGHGQEPADVLNDIGNMLANLTDELDAMLEEEKRQGLSQ
ncbi:uncharacterized protein LOC124172067 isoform X2 [Ischnura elegans]|uniref:uncharacterized protein LOC124172067 isoform X2 n=1 Tax=Ischnura elegans TaxID=197161 RepID=UPI001ED889BC|nr:uncharacterized protein LOC124172067 isoform X2 [Ischnura elegans]